MADAASAAANGPPPSDPVRTVEVRVLEPGDACNVYAWDADAAAPRLERILRPLAPRGADLARLPLLSGFSRRAASTQTDESGGPLRRKFRFGELTERAPDLDQPASSGQTANGLDAELLAGPGLLALVLADPPNPPGAWVRARVLGAWRPVEVVEEMHAGIAPSQRETSVREAPAEAASLEALLRWTLIAIPVADTVLKGITGIVALPLGVRGRLAQALRAVGAGASDGEGMPIGEWLDASAAFDLCTQARLIARRTRGAAGAAAASAGTSNAPRAQDKDVASARVAWRVLAGVSAAELRALGPGAYSEAEHLLRFVPARFGRYLGALLRPDERVLFFAERDAIVPREGGLRTLLPGRHGARLQAGLLLLTDQQVLCVRDYAPPDATLVEWGYLARSYPLGRVVGAGVLPPGATLFELDAALLPGLPGTPDERLGALHAAVRAADPETQRELGAARLARLVLVVAARGGIEVACMAMPDAARGGLDWTAAFLRDCAPRVGAAATRDRRVRPLPVVEAWRPTAVQADALDGLGGEIAPALRVALDTQLAGALVPGEEWLVTARAADLSVTGGGMVAAHALGLTARHLILTSARISPRTRTDHAQMQTALTTAALGELSSATLQLSLLGCALWATRPRVGEPASRKSQGDSPPIAIGFASPASTSFQTLFIRLRTLLGGSLAT